jgi:hypothetical protein
VYNTRLVLLHEPLCSLLDLAPKVASISKTCVSVQKLTYFGKRWQIVSPRKKKLLFKSLDKF